MKSPRCFTFGSANIKGTPAMTGAQARWDLRVARRHCTILVLQEFRHRHYWKAIADLKRNWASWPGYRAGRWWPNRAAGALMWRKRRFSKINQAVRILHEGVPKVSETRYLRAVLLREKSTGLHAWFGGCHFVVKGDRRGGPSANARILHQHDLPRFREFVSGLLASGHPVLWGMDANIHKHTQAHRDLLAIVDELGGTIIGEHGVEYLIHFPGRHARFKVESHGVVPAAKLHTDHEIRLVTGTLQPNRKA